MKTIGELIKEKRISEKASLQKIERITKIKSDFISSIEKGNWSSLPQYATVLGFVKTLAQHFEIDENRAVALFRRDYPLKNEEDINPKPDLSKKFSWSPRFTFWLGFAVVFLLITGYLVFQYRKFISSPGLQLDSPGENQVVTNDFVRVAGKTDSDAAVLVNNQPVLTTSDGDFEIDLEISFDTKEIVVKATSRSGKETVIRRNIETGF